MSTLLPLRDEDSRSYFNRDGTASHANSNGLPGAGQDTPRQDPFAELDALLRKVKDVLYRTHYPEVEAGLPLLEQDEKIRTPQTKPHQPHSIGMEGSAAGSGTVSGGNFDDSGAILAAQEQLLAHFAGEMTNYIEALCRVVTAVGLSSSSSSSRPGNASVAHHGGTPSQQQQQHPTPHHGHGHGGTIRSPSPQQHQGHASLTSTTPKHTGSGGDSGGGGGTSQPIRTTVKKYQLMAESCLSEFQRKMTRYFDEQNRYKCDETSLHYRTVKASIAPSIRNLSDIFKKTTSLQKEQQNSKKIERQKKRIFDLCSQLGDNPGKYIHHAVSSGGGGELQDFELTSQSLGHQIALLERTQRERFQALVNKHKELAFVRKEMCEPPSSADEVHPLIQACLDDDRGVLAADDYKGILAKSLGSDHSSPLITSPQRRTVPAAVATEGDTEGTSSIEPLDLSESTLEQTQSLLLEIEGKKTARLNVIRDLASDIISLWKQDSFAPSVQDPDLSDMDRKLLQLMKSSLTNIEGTISLSSETLHYLAEKKQELVGAKEDRIRSTLEMSKRLRLIEDRQFLLDLMKQVEAQAKNPLRLFGHSGRLLQEERFRNSAYPRLLLIEAVLRPALMLYKERHGTPFLYQGSDYLELLDKELMSRTVPREIFPTVGMQADAPRTVNRASVDDAFDRGQRQLEMKRRVSRQLTGPVAPKRASKPEGTSGGDKDQQGGEDGEQQTRQEGNKRRQTGGTSFAMRASSLSEQQSSDVPLSKSPSITSPLTPSSPSSSFKSPLELLFGEVLHEDCFTGLAQAIADVVEDKVADFARVVKLSATVKDTLAERVVVMAKRQTAADSNSELMHPLDTTTNNGTGGPSSPSALSMTPSTVHIPTVQGGIGESDTSWAEVGAKNGTQKERERQTMRLLELGWRLPEHYSSRHNVTAEHVDGLIANHKASLESGTNTAGNARTSTARSAGRQQQKVGIGMGSDGTQQQDDRKRREESKTTPRDFPLHPEPPKYYVARPPCTTKHNKHKTCAETVEAFALDDGDNSSSGRGKRKGGVQVPPSTSGYIQSLTSASTGGAVSSSASSSQVLLRHQGLDTLPTTRNFSAPDEPLVLKTKELVPKGTRKLLVAGSTPRGMVSINKQQLENITSRPVHTVRYSETDAAKALQKEREAAYRSHHVEQNRLESVRLKKQLR